MMHSWYYRKPPWYKNAWSQLGIAVSIFIIIFLSVLHNEASLVPVQIHPDKPTDKIEYIHFGGNYPFNVTVHQNGNMYTVIVSPREHFPMRTGEIPAGENNP